MAYFARLMHHTGIGLGGTSATQSQHKVAPLEVDVLQETGQPRHAGTPVAPREAEADSLLPAVPDMTTPEAPRTLNGQPLPANPLSPVPGLPARAQTLVPADRIAARDHRPSMPAAETQWAVPPSATNPAAGTAPAPEHVRQIDGIVEETRVQETRSIAAPDPEDVASVSPARARPSVVPRTGIQYLAEVREWVAASPARRDMAADHGGNTRAKLPDSGSATIEDTATAAPLRTETLSLNIGTIEVTVEEPPKPILSVLPNAASPRAAQPSTGPSDSRLSRRYLQA